MFPKLFRLALCTIILFCAASCKKDSTSSTPDQYVKIKKNGTWKTYSKVAGELGPDLLNSSKTDFGVSAFTDDNAESFDLTIQINGSNFVTGTYYSDNADYYVDANFTTGFNSNEIQHYYIQNGVLNEDAHYTVKVTSITPTYLTGSFTGNYLYDSFASDSGIVRITEGEFRVKRIR